MVTQADDGVQVTHPHGPTTFELSLNLPHVPRTPGYLRLPLMPQKVFFPALRLFPSPCLHPLPPACTPCSLPCPLALPPLVTGASSRLSAFGADKTSLLVGNALLRYTAPSSITQHHVSGTLTTRDSWIGHVSCSEAFKQCCSASGGSTEDVSWQVVVLRTWSASCQRPLTSTCH